MNIKFFCLVVFLGVVQQVCRARYKPIYELNPMKKEDEDEEIEKEKNGINTRNRRQEGLAMNKRWCHFFPDRCVMGVPIGT